MKTQKTQTTKLASGLLPAALILVMALPVLAQGPYAPGGGITVPAQPLTAEETQWLGFMREEEKMARDVYQQLFEKWNLAAFSNISASEDRHFSAVGVLLSRYGAPDPAQNNPAGIYSDTKLSALYSELIAKGTQSIKDAIEVGVLIEKADIADLETALKDTAKLDIKRVFTNLLDGSFNHLEAFEANLEIVCLATPN